MGFRFGVYFGSGVIRNLASGLGVSLGLVWSEIRVGLGFGPEIWGLLGGSIWGSILGLELSEIWHPGWGSS
jgi:hypothetical protein